MTLEIIFKIKKPDKTITIALTEDYAYWYRKDQQEIVQFWVAKTSLKKDNKCPYLFILDFNFFGKKFYDFDIFNGYQSLAEVNYDWFNRILINTKRNEYPRDFKLINLQDVPKHYLTEFFHQIDKLYAAEYHLFNSSKKYFFVEKLQMIQQNQNVTIYEKDSRDSQYRLFLQKHKNRYSSLIFE